MRIFGFFQLALLGILLCSGPSASHAFSLDEVEREVERDYPRVRQLMPDALSSATTDSKPLVIDVREAGEFAVSHIPGAKRVRPGISTARFMKQFGKLVQGRQVVFYCSVGVRSSQLAEAVQDQLMKAGAKSVHNLKGGVFRWHNERRALVNASGVTDFVHPYNRRWGTLVKRSKGIRYRPGN